jgi:hypothetical protein
MNGIDDFKNEVLKKIKKLQYQIKKLTQLNHDLMKKNKIVNDWLSDSRSRNAEVLAENFALKKIIAGQKRKITDEGFVECDEAMEMPKGLTKNEVITVIGSKIKP